MCRKKQRWFLCYSWRNKLVSYITGCGQFVLNMFNMLNMVKDTRSAAASAAAAAPVFAKSKPKMCLVFHEEFGLLSANCIIYLMFKR